jgi:ABC-type microcin C transport system permease subunit YejE
MHTRGGGGNKWGSRGSSAMVCLYLCRFCLALETTPFLFVFAFLPHYHKASQAAQVSLAMLLMFSYVILVVYVTLCS